MTGDWRYQAACRGQDPELWFPVGESDRYEPQTEAAKAICRRCPAMQQCGQWALDTRQDTGIWGGLDERDRRRIHRRAQEQRRQQQAA